MSEERKLILQMVAEGKITAEEAEKLLQAIEETELTAQSAAADEVHSRVGGNLGESIGRAGDDLGAAIERAVNDGLRGLDATMRKLEINLDRRLNDPARDRLISSMEERIRRSVERSVEQATRAEERAKRAAERATERAQDATRRAAERAAERAEEMARRMKRLKDDAGGTTRQFVKYGLAIDRVSVERTETFRLPAQPGDRIVLENRVGDVRVEFCDGTDVDVTVRKQVWGENDQDANERADATVIDLMREGPDVNIVPRGPSVMMMGGFLWTKDTRLDFTIRVPQGTNLQIHTKVGDFIILGAQKVGVWLLSSKVGDADIKVAQAAGFTYELSTKVGDVQVAAAGAQEEPVKDQAYGKGGFRTGRVADGAGRIEVTTKTGDIRLSN